MLLFLSACKPDAAPRDLDEVFHAAFADYAAQDEDGLTADVADFERLVDPDGDAVDGTISDLSDDEVALTDLPRDIDISTAVGIFTIGTVDCDAQTLEKILYDLHQDELYPDNYTDGTYSRTYTSDFDAYSARDDHQLWWTSDFGINIDPFYSYTAEVWGGMHYLPIDGGTALFSRTVMPEAATDVTPDGGAFDIDFQSEAYFPSDAGMTHVYAMWRHIDIVSLSTDDDTMVSLIIGGMHGWDDKTSAICEDGGP